MTSEFWKNDPKDHYRVFKDKNGRQVLKVVAQGGVVALQHGHPCDNAPGS